MPQQDPEFTIGLEEEYLLVDLETYDLAVAPDQMMADCERALESQVSPEFLQCQIEVGTRVCKTVADARADLGHLRTTIARIAGEYGLAPLAVSCHPFADWKDQHHTNKQRYNDLKRDLAGVGRRMLICGQHIHVGLNDDNLRIDLMNQFSYFLPHLLALSTSSPFWQGEDTGLGSYRLSVFDNLPRTGLPPQFKSYDEYQRSVQMIINSGLIQDSSKIWWDLRPSARFPTLESRICDVSPRLNDALAIAALTQSLMRMLWRLRKNNQRWRIYDNFLIAENRWRAQRYGVNQGMIDFGQGKVVAFDDLTEELIAMLGEDATALGCLEELQSTRRILTDGTSADRQRAVFARSIAVGAGEQEALVEVVKSLISEYSQDL